MVKYDHRAILVLTQLRPNNVQIYSKSLMWPILDGQTVDHFDSGGKEFKTHIPDCFSLKINLLAFATWKLRTGANAMHDVLAIQH